MSLTEAFYRRLYTFYKPSESEEFYDKNQIRDKAGKWTRGGDRPSKGLARPTSNKIWSGVSAHPDRRKAPKSDLKFPIERDTYENQKEANFRFARSVYDTDLGGGYRSKTTAVEVFDGKEMSVRGVITHKGKEVGTFDRGISIEKRGKVVVDHTELMIGSIHRSKGLADRFNSHAVARYQELGVDRVTLHAGDSVGGFAWARQGFRFATPEIAKSVGNRALDNIENSAKYLPALRNDKAALMREVKAVRKALNAGEDVQPIHIASIGERIKWETVGISGDNVRFMTWPGKRAMLMSSWEGVYYFDANNAVTAAASSIEHANLRPQTREKAAPKPLSNHELVELAFKPNQRRDKDGQWTTGGVSVTVPAGTVLYKGTIWGSSLRVADSGESGAGVYTTPDKALADMFTAGKAEYSDKAETITMKTNRPLKLIDRSTPEGEELHRSFGPNTEGAIQRMKDAGYDGVSYPGTKWQAAHEVIVHDTAALSVVVAKNR